MKYNKNYQKKCKLEAAFGIVFLIEKIEFKNVISQLVYTFN